MHPRVCFREWNRVFRKTLQWKVGPFENTHRFPIRKRGIIVSFGTLVFGRDGEGNSYTRFSR